MFMLEKQKNIYQARESTQKTCGLGYATPCCILVKGKRAY